MKIAYLILAHKNPQQLRRLIDRLNGQDVSFFIHIDTNADIEDFKALLNSSDYKIKFVKRERAAWGSFGIVQATLNGLQEAFKHSEFDYLILLSGQCYPIQSNDSIKKFFNDNYGQNFMEFFIMPGPEWTGIYGMDRIDRYHFNFMRKRTFPPDESPKTLLGKILNILFGMRFPMPRVFPKGMVPYGGAQWFSLHRDGLKYILDFVAANPYYIKFNKYTFIPDELFFHSILLNAPANIKSKMTNADLRYIDWNKKNVVLPAILKKEDINAIKNSSHLFARKFDDTIDSEIMDMIDQHITQGAGKC